MSKTRILIVDDHWVVIEGIRAALNEYPEFEVVGDASDGRGAVKLAASLRPEIVIMDISMPNLNGMDATLQIKKVSSDIQIIIYTMHSDREFVVDFLRAGISAYVLKEDPVSDLIFAVKAVSNGDSYFSTMTPKILLKDTEGLENYKTGKNSFDALSLRQREVFQLLAEGKSLKDIASLLCISPKTVESHKSHIMKKLDLHSVTDLVKLAIRKNIVPL